MDPSALSGEPGQTRCRPGGRTIVQSKAKTPSQPKKKGKARKQELADLYRKMYLIRQFEEVCGEMYTRGLIRGFLHLYIGQEAIAVGAISRLQPHDYIVTHYRDHGHALARGVASNRTMAELFGRIGGLNKGKGGSMHLFDAEKGVMGGHAIVGGQFPLAAGLAFSHQYRKTDGICLVFFGDGATNQGTYHEVMNLAAVWKLPMLFFLENNLYGMGSRFDRVRGGGDDFYTGAAMYGIEHAVAVDGMDVLAVQEATEVAIKGIRAGNGPAFIEAKTFRFQGHSMADPVKYRDSAETEAWEARDPIVTFPRDLLAQELVTEAELEKIRASVDDEVAEAVKFAENSPFPPDEELYTDIYA
ncbi:MAG: pyruvate dehydrogenase (acetyl-transferring) E1 component subunit alpha [Chloroflexi bacterium]|nr:pyruvate dehydrogenase (acetyl-transferring) E1 component subunit alpha [Chloroflexota bacterium]MCH8235055.1 pyruvate dehydrogenase (acetyl-transferring) E1 component subunit alpha [Chloroflexota bacterium]MCH8816914.1 pyruvate dehydrogenase (acetyl-transferring) E1 component subunit alpha [Chloroflexota bacterium]